MHDFPRIPPDLAKQLNNRIIAESVENDCQLPETAGSDIGFEGCTLKNGYNPEFEITSSEKRFWENTTARTDGLPRVPPNFKCEDFYNVDLAKNPVAATEDNGMEIAFRNAYKNILCGLGATTEVSSACEGDIESLKNECEAEKSKWANELERQYVKLNFNQTGDSIDAYEYLSAGANHNCVINQGDGQDGGGVYCFGDNSKGQLGQAKYDSSSNCLETDFDNLVHEVNFFPYPIRVRNSTNTGTDEYMSSVRQIAVGANFNCARITQTNNQTAGPKLRCWGEKEKDVSSVRGNPDPVSDECYPNVQVPEAITPCNGETTLASIDTSTLVDLEDVLSIVAGRTHACAVRECTNDASEVLCWGDNKKRQLGRTGTHTESEHALPVILEVGEAGSSTHTPLINVDESRLSANRDLTCFIKEGEVFCWGQYRSPLEDSVSEIVLPERLSLQCEARDSGQDTASNFLIK